MTCSNKVKTRKCAYHSKQPFSRAGFFFKKNESPPTPIQEGFLQPGSFSSSPTHHLATTTTKQKGLKKKPSEMPGF